MKYLKLESLQKQGKLRFPVRTAGVTKSDIMRKHLLQILIISFIFLIYPIIHAAEEEKDRLLVVPLKAQIGIQKEEAILLTDILSVELYRSGKFTILNRDDMKAVLTEKEFELAMGCDDNVCLLENVAKLAVNKLVAGNIGKLGNKYVVSIRMINEDGENEIMERDYCDCPLEELTKSIERISFKFLKYLVGEVAMDGSIRVESEPGGARIYLDGDNIGTTPDSIRYINPGTYKVEVKMDGYKVWSKRVNVEASEEVPVFARLEAETKKLEEEKRLIEEEWRRLKKERELAEIETHWSEWQHRLEYTYNKTLKHDEDTNLSVKEKAQIWQDLIKNFEHDNPYSTEDEAMRSHAMRRLEYWRNFPEEQKPPSPPHIQPPKTKQVFLRSHYKRDLSLAQAQSMPYISIREKKLERV